MIVSVVSVITSGWITFAWNPARRDSPVNGIMNKRSRHAYLVKQGVILAIMIGSVIRFPATRAAISMFLFTMNYNMEAACKFIHASRTNISQHMTINV